MRNPFIHYRRLLDEDLMRMVGMDSSSAFEEIYRRYAEDINGFLYRRLQGDAEQAADYTQDVFTRLWLARYRYETGLSLRPWLYTIAYNLLRNHYRQTDYAADFVAEEQYLQEEAEYDNTPLRIDRERLDAALRQVLHGLPERQQLLFDLRYTEELSVPQIAQILELPEGTVKSRLHTIMNHLRQQLKAYEDIR